MTTTLARALPAGAMLRRVVIVVGGFVGLLLFTQLILPGTGGGRGTPGGILFTGLVLGVLNALTAAGLVLIYRTHRVVNFAQTAIGAVGGELTFQLLQLKNAPFWLAFPAGLIVAALAGLVFDLVIVKRFSKSARLVLTVATIAAADLLRVATALGINHLPIFPKNRNIEQQLGSASLRSFLPFPGWHFTVGHLQIRFGFAEVFAIEVAVLALLLLAAFFRFTRAGVAVRAMAENAERASLLGISVGALSSIVWTLAGLLAGIGVILTGLVLTPGTASGIAPAILLPAFAAAVIGRMRNLPVTVVAAVAISVLSQAVSWSYPKDQALVNVGLFVVVGLGLLLQRRDLVRSEEGSNVSWEAAEEQRPVPHVLRGLPPVRITRYALYAAGLLLLVGYPFLFSTGSTVLAAGIALNTIVALSLIVLTGWAGQVSLGQFGFAAIGAVVAGALGARAGLPFPVAVVLAACVTGLVAVLVGIPALRIKGLFLGVATFSFAIAVSAALFNKRYFGWLLPDQVKRPSFLFLNFTDERSMYFLCVSALVLCIVLVANLRRSRFGRILIAVRENEANLQSFGVAAVRAKLTAFAVSGALAGFAGAIYAYQLRGVSGQSFLPQRSVDVFLFAVLGGVTSVSGVLMGSTYYSAIVYAFPGNFIFESLRPLSVIGVLWFFPGGFISMINRMRDGVLRIIAQRRQIVVPSLFADYDPEVLEKRLIPLALPLDAAGLAVLDPDDRYEIESGLYAGVAQPGAKP